MISVLKVIISIALSLANVFAIPFVGHMNDYFKVKKPDEIRMNLAVISDTHVQDSVIRQAMLELGLEDMERSYDPIDALLITGDITDHGYKEQYENNYHPSAGAGTLVILVISSVSSAAGSVTGPAGSG